MEKVVVEFIGEKEFIPYQGTEHSAGGDLKASVMEPIVIEPKKRLAVPTGLSMAIPVGFEGEVRPRSGLAFKHGITVLNSPGTIDSDYRGEIKVILINLGEEPFTIKRGDRIAQILIKPVVKAEFKLVEKISSTERGEGGFGSTGV